MKSIILTAIALPGLVFAQDQNNYQCSHGDLQRRVEIVYETGVTVPCEVHYYKDTEAPGERQVLWRALQQEGYCEAKTAILSRNLAHGAGIALRAATQHPRRLRNLKRPLRLMQLTIPKRWRLSNKSTRLTIRRL